MKDWKKALIQSTATIIEAIKVIDQAALQIGMVVDESGRLLGTLTDGDIRRGILKGISLEGSVKLIMNTHAVAVRASDTKKALALMKEKALHQIPVLDDADRVIGLKVVEDLIKDFKRDNWVVLMAGGVGSRLKPLTDNCPKPLLKVNGKPILEIILENCLDYGFSRFCVCVNYKAEMIKDYFGDGSKWNSEIVYIHEEQKMGTAGALSLIQNRPEQPFFVMNGDLLTKVNFHQLMDFHELQKTKATMCVREYDVRVPYGVVRVSDTRILSIDEKPLQKHFVNAGIYVLEPDVLDLIPKHSYFDMPSLFEKLISANQLASVFPIHEYWMDIGRMDDYEQVQTRVVGELE